MLVSFAIGNLTAYTLATAFHPHCATKAKPSRAGVLGAALRRQAFAIHHRFRPRAPNGSRERQEASANDGRQPITPRKPDKRPGRLSGFRGGENCNLQRPRTAQVACEQHAKRVAHLEPHPPPHTRPSRLSAYKPTGSIQEHGIMATVGQFFAFLNIWRQVATTRIRRILVAAGLHVYDLGFRQ